jgi:1,4-dihydroxy-2-naphthoyl-CoA hydrolase
MTIWFDAKSLPATPYAPAFGTLSHHLGIVVTEFLEDGVVATLPVDDRTRQVVGLLHGGASVALAETLMSFGAICTVDKRKFSVVGLEINANHLRGVREGHVTGTAKPLHLGRSTQVWTCEIRDVDGNLVCSSRMTISVLERKV